MRERKQTIERQRGRAAPEQQARCLHSRDGPSAGPGHGETSRHGLAARRAIESPSFPFEQISLIAGLESWRKEIYRPIYHLHKWWAQRLGSVFRAILIASALPEGADIVKAFYSKADFPDLVVFDPFMGSGTTIGEGLKLGMRMIGRDINPVAYRATKVAFSLHKVDQTDQVFCDLEDYIRPFVQRYYHTVLQDGTVVDVLYYFWVKQVACPRCGHMVDLFDSYIFVKHAYPSRYPEALAVCPACGAIVRTTHNATMATCGRCETRFNPTRGPAQGALATCPRCHHAFRIIQAVRGRDEPPAHRLYAKLIRLPDGEKRYVEAEGYDVELYRKATEELAQHEGLYPVVPILPGHNTNQVLGYSYRYWHQMFNSRQLLILGLLGRRIKGIEDPVLRELFVVLFSGMLEFNNMFASYKGEGTGAVRPLYAHHILKPEKRPLEANPWLAPSGSFPALYRQRLLRAMSYSRNPFELIRQGRMARKVYGLADPIAADAVSDFHSFARGGRLYLSCGDSARTDIESNTVDLVVTDPPYFDNVYYSELADFFFIWQNHLLGNGAEVSNVTTRSPQEVQTSDVDEFGIKLTQVWRECHRVLRKDGLLVFTFHQSDVAGWRALLRSLMQAGFVVTAIHPVRAELSRAVPKSQAKQPILYDVIVVCRKREYFQAKRETVGNEDPVKRALESARAQLERLITAKLPVGQGDAKSLAFAHLIKHLSQMPSVDQAIRAMDAYAEAIERAISAYIPA